MDIGATKKWATTGGFIGATTGDCPYNVVADEYIGGVKQQGWARFPGNLW